MSRLKIETHAVCAGYDGKRCLVHARCCQAPRYLLATAQYLDVTGIDLFSGIYMALSTDGGATWSRFEPQESLAPQREGDLTVVGCDATPLYHKKTGRILLLGHTAAYSKEKKHPVAANRHTFYSFYHEREGRFGKRCVLPMPSGFEECGNGSGQSLELENGELLIPVYFLPRGEGKQYAATVLRCAVAGEELCLLEIGNFLTIPAGRGLYEPSIIQHNGSFYMTLRSDDDAYVCQSEDGLRYGEPQLWRWQDGEVLPSYNTQQHWMRVGKALYLIYTRRGADNDHVFRHRAPLFAARVEGMRLVRESERVLVPQRGARLGNFGAESLADGSAIVMAAEWMQPVGCERYGSDNTVYFLRVTEDE